MMLDRDKERCFELAHLLLGKAANIRDIEEVVASVSTFEEFRVALVLKYEDADPRAREVADTWRKLVDGRLNAGHINDLAHTGEVLALKRSEMEEMLRANTREMLEKFKAIDGLATVQAEMRERLSEVNDMIDKFRQQSARIERIVVPEK
jgi:hypothetical protein